jgi:putative FmdB family regulatory protein
MPLYEYQCEACGRSEEVLEPLSAPDHHACQACGAPEGMRRQLSVPALASAAAGPAEAPPCATGGSCDGGCPFAGG